MHAVSQKNLSAVEKCRDFKACFEKNFLIWISSWKGRFSDARLRGGDMSKILECLNDLFTFSNKETKQNRKFYVHPSRGGPR